MQREKWVDYTKAFACILVVLGHLLQGLNKANVIWNQTAYSFLDTFIYLFHMPLFMALSGYLYAKTVKIEKMREYYKFIKKKLLNLGIPFIIFYLLFVGINMLFSHSVNTQYGMNEILSMFTNPIPPFWFLYALFFIFLLIPLIEKISKNNKTVVFIVLLCLHLLGIFLKTNIYFIDIFMQYAFYFYLGVMYYQFNQRKIVFASNIKLGIQTVLYVGLSIMYYIFVQKVNLPNIWNIVAMGMAIAGTLLSIQIIQKSENILKNSNIYEVISKYTFQIFLLHTIFTAGIRILLIKCNITNFYLQFGLGLMGGIGLPILAAMIAEKSKYLNFFFFPSKVIHKKTR